MHRVDRSSDCSSADHHLLVSTHSQQEFDDYRIGVRLLHLFYLYADCFHHLRYSAG